MPAGKSDPSSTLNANLAALVRELQQLGQKVKPSEQRRPEQPAALVIKGK